MEIRSYLEHQEKETPNIKNVKALYEALNSGDSITISTLLNETPTWNVCPGCPEGGTYQGMNEVFGTFYRKLLKNFRYFKGEPEVFIDGGDAVVALGFYCFTVREGAPINRVRFSHTWKIATNGRIEGVWQVCDSSEMYRLLKE